MQQEQQTIDFRGLILLICVGAWLTGIFLDSIITSFSVVSPLQFLACITATLILIILLWDKRQMRLIAIILLCLLLGAWRYNSSLPSNDPLTLPYSDIGKSLAVRGTVSDEPKLYGNNHLLSITISGISQDKGTTWQEMHGQFTAEIRGTAIEDPYGANYGSVLELQGKLQPPLPHSAPDILANMFFPQISVTDTSGNPILAALYAWRITLSTIIEQVLPQPEAALLVAILLGLRTPALNVLASAFKATGTMHLIVSSGFKVTLLAGLVGSCTRWIYKNEIQEGKLLPAQKRGGWRRWLSTSLTLASIVAYTILNGAGPAAIRAGIMGCLLQIAPRIGRTYNVYTALALTALIMSFSDPFLLWDVGFQLSFIGTLGIVLFTPYFQRLLLSIEHLPLSHILNETVAVTLAVEVATLPIFALDFQQVSLIAPIANTLTVPFLGMLIMLGVLICGIGLLSLPLATLIGWVAWPLLKYVVWCVQWCASIPGAAIPINITNSGIAWCYYALLVLVAIFILRKWPISTKNTVTHTLLFGLPKRTWQLIQVGMALLAITITGTNEFVSLRTNADLTLTFLAITSKGQPQGEVLLLQTPDHKTILIDGGPDASSLAQELDSNLPTWQRSLDAVVLTAPRQDHIVGLLDVVQRYTIGKVIDAGMLHPDTTYAGWRRTISERNIPYLIARQGVDIRIGNFVSLQILWPPSPLHKGSNEVRDNSLILRITTPTGQLLLLGIGAQSKFALSGLLDTIDPTYLQAKIVQIVDGPSASYPEELDSVLQSAHPACLLITPSAITKKPQTGSASTGQTPISLPGQQRQWKNIPAIYAEQVEKVQINTNQQDWCINT
jgi:competence protein ComEC